MSRARDRGMFVLAAAVLAAGCAFDVAPRSRLDDWNILVSWGPGASPVDAALADRQSEPDGCGAAALAVVLRAHGTHVPQRLLWSVSRLPEGGTRLGDLSRAAVRFGHRAEVGNDPRLEHVMLPAIVHLRRGHFVVLEARAGGDAIVFDPGCGRVRVSLGALRRRASGAVLVVDAPAVDA